MAAYYVDSAGSNTSPYDTWAKAATSFATAVAAAIASGDIIYVDQGFIENLGSNTTYTFANDVSVICSNDKTNAPPQTLGVMGTSAWIGSDSASRAITVSGGYKVYWYGITLRNAGGNAGGFSFAQSDGSHHGVESCYFWFSNTAGSTSLFTSGNIGGASNAFFRATNCTFRFSLTGHGFAIGIPSEYVGCTIIADAGSITDLVKLCHRGPHVLFLNTDLSAVSTNLVINQTNVAFLAYFVNCRLASGVVAMASQTVTNKGAVQVYVYNCSSGDEHYQMGHHDSFGSTIVDTGIYANDGAKYDGMNGCSWKIITTANCSYYTPYVSPWIDVYHSGTSAITPSLEIVRSGSATAYQDDEVWAEFSYQGTSGFPLATIVSDRKGLLASAADQTTGALVAGDWTGENATSWFGKLNPTSAITPAEIGHLRARVCVGEPSVTVYVCPTIRGRS